MKRTCVRVSHQLVSQRVDVTLMQMTSVDSYEWKKEREPLLQEPEPPWREDNISLSCLPAMHSFPNTSQTRV